MKKLVLISLATAVGLFAQGPGGPGGRLGGRMGFQGPMGPGGPQHTVTGAPYSGTEVTTTQQVLSNGNSIQRQRQTTVYRDSQGRVRTETTAPARPGASSTETPSTIVTIHDPVSGTLSHIDNKNRVVNQTTIHRPNATGAAAGQRAAVRGPNAQRPADPNVVTENLGLQTMNGVAATGTRITRTIPAGTMGNAQAIQSVREVWTSGDLKVPVMVKTSDPRFGTTVTQLTNINRAEPDAALFQPPAGYTVKQGPPARPMGRPRGNQ